MQKPIQKENAGVAPREEQQSGVSQNKASFPQAEKEKTSNTSPRVPPVAAQAVVASVSKEAPMQEWGEEIPKSKPKGEKDRYIRKRMIVAGSYYCEASALEALFVGAYIDLEAEPENPYDPNAIKLTYQGQKIGYIAQKDLELFSACIKLQRKIYGVITDIRTEEGRVQYEYETWFGLT